MTHHPCDDVNWNAGLEQLGGYAVPEAVNPNVNAFGRFDSELLHGSVHAISHDIVGQIGLAVRIGEEITGFVWFVVLLDPVLQALGEQRRA